VKRRKNNGHRRRLPREAMLARDAQIFAMHLRGMSPTEVGDELGMARQTAERSIKRSENLHANDGSLDNLQACIDNVGTGEPEDDPNLTPEQNGRVWDAWMQTLTVADVERIARTPHPELLLHRLKFLAVNAFLSSGELVLEPDVMQAVNVAWGATRREDDDAVGVGDGSWREGVERARGEYIDACADDEW